MDINDFRKEKGGDPEKIKESQRRRFKDVEIVDEIVKLDEKWRKQKFQLDEKKAEAKRAQKSIAELKKAKKDAKEAIENYKKMKEEAKVQETETDELWKEIQTKLNTIGNYVHSSVPVSKDEEHNKIHKEWGTKKEKSGTTKHHDELLWMIGGYEPEKGARVVGHRGYYLTGLGVALNQALINYALQFAFAKGYQPIYTPFFMNKDVMAHVAQLEQFDEELYKVQGGGEEKYLIATSEQPLCAVHWGEWIETDALPIRYIGTSTCFRKEGGSSGKDVRGIFRVHQFDKVEQFCVTAPEKSWEEHEKMLGISEEFFQSLGIPYRVVVIVSGELNNAAAKKYDLEGWFPCFQEYKELVSCSNCTDYQSRRLEIRYGSSKKQGDTQKQYVHMLNSTLCATTRTICALLENGQTEDGIRVPDVLKPFLKPYLKDENLIPFIRENRVITKGGKKVQKKKSKAAPKKQEGGN